MRAVEKLQDMVADQAAKRASLARYSCQFNATVSGAALGTGDVGLSHARKGNMVVPVILRTGEAIGPSHDDG